MPHPESGSQVSLALFSQLVKVSTFKMSGKSMLTPIVYGPNPDSPHRDGGVAVWMRYLKKICSLSGIQADFLYIDRAFIDRLPLPRVIKRAIGSIWCSTLLVLSRSDQAILHVNASLYPTTILRDAPVVAGAAIRGTPIFFQIHGGRLANLDRGTVSHWLGHWMLRKADRLGIHPGPQWEEFTQAGYEVKSIPMYNAVPSTPYFAAVDEKGAHFLFLGRIVEEKGVRDILEVVLRLRSEGYDEVALTIAGDGPLLEEVRRIVRASKYSDSIYIEGFVQGSALDEVLNRANIFVLPSRHQEGFPFSFLECAERGMACIVTENSAIPEVFTAGEDFQPVDIADTNSLYLQMKRLTVDIEYRSSLGRSIAGAVGSCCTVEAAAGRFRRLYTFLSQNTPDKHWIADQG